MQRSLHTTRCALAAGILAAAAAPAALAQDQDGYWFGIQEPGDAGYAQRAYDRAPQRRAARDARALDVRRLDARRLDAAQPPDARPLVRKYYDQAHVWRTYGDPEFSGRGYYDQDGVWRPYSYDDYDDTFDYRAQREPLVDVAPGLYGDTWDTDTGTFGHDEYYTDIWYDADDQ